MSQQGRFEIIFDDKVFAHFARIPYKDHASILDAIEQQLMYEATVQTRNRKRLRLPNALDASWELRCGADNRYRVFYGVDMESQIVSILAIGRKDGNRLFIGVEEFLL